MRTSVILGVAAATTMSAAATASPLSGLWRTPVHNATIEVYDCGDAICGRVRDSDLLRQQPDLRDIRNSDPAKRDTRVRGETIMSGFTGGPTEWKGGQIYNPDDGHTYHGTVTVTEPGTLKLTGCVVFPLCRTQVWHKQS